MNRLEVALALYPIEHAKSKYHTARTAWRCAYYLARLHELMLRGFRGGESVTPDPNERTYGELYVPR